MSDELSADEIIKQLDLQPLADEGGMWTRTWLDEFSSAIYFLLRPGDFSALHRLSTAELWHFYAGAPVQMLLLCSDGLVQQPVLGPDIASGQRPVVPVPASTWMAAETLGAWSLLGATMAPPYDETDFELGDEEVLSSQFPTAAEQIARFVRKGQGKEQS